MSPGNRERDPVPGAPPNNSSRCQATRYADSTPARPLPVNIVGQERYHALIAQGYVITGVCRSCGAPLTNRRSVDAGVGPVCGKRVAGND
jgi:Family of unknown function (DUF6011)